MVTIKHMGRILFAAKDVLIVLRMSRPLFAGSYLPIKRKEICIE